MKETSYRASARSHNHLRLPVPLNIHEPRTTPLPTIAIEFRLPVLAMFCLFALVVDLFGVPFAGFVIAAPAYCDDARLAC